MKLQIFSLILFFSCLIKAQEKILIEETDSLKLYETYLSLNSSDNVYPTFFNNGLVFASSYNSNYYKLYYSNLKSDPVKIKINSKFNLGPVAIFNNEIYFTGNSKKLSTGQQFNLTIYKGKIENFKVSKIKELQICNPNYTYAHPAISVDGKYMVIVTNENNAYHLLELKRDENNEWKRSEILFIAQVNFEIINPTFFDENTIYFSSNYYKGGIDKISVEKVNGELKIIDKVMETDSFNIYKMERINGKWQLPVLASELNSDFDDLGVLFTSKNTGYLNTYRYNNSDNIYFFELKF